ncbi:golgin subfamily A member 4-like isoform X2 [Zophobas morio]|uniref:golgin subfamily A member 4-like isoform X2 n=1 Tax=Zophobas morio TaxID=2755281 RepID=UPI0030832BB8
MDNIIDYIYKSCDPTNTNLVQVSSLISVIKPYMPNNPRELVDLQSKLDPHSTNPNIDCTFFQKVMSDWIANIQENDINNSLSDFPVNQTISPNLSQISGSCSVNNNNKIVNESNLPAEEQIADLKLKLNKVTSELDLVKQQLAACEDQNESLLSDLKSQKLQNKERRSELVRQKAVQSEEIREEIHVDYKKCEQLERMLSSSDKQQQVYLAQIGTLENENLYLKNKLQLLEKVKQEDKKSLSDMRDSLDEKDTEISTLMELIDDVKSQLEEKADLLNFYVNEHRLLKQKIHDLEAVIKNNICHNSTALAQEPPLGGSFQHIFNTPKLLNQLANPITPMIRDFSTSSPLKDTPLRRNFNCNGGPDLLSSSLEAVTACRTSPKTLKDELAEVSCIRLNESEDELGRLHKLVKDQEDMKNHLWENMKQLSKDNEELQDYKKEYLDLMLRVQEKDQALREMKNELNEKNQALTNMKKEMELLKEKPSAIGHLTDELTNLEDNLIKQKSISTNLKTNLEYVAKTLEQEVCEQLFKEAKSTQTEQNTTSRSVQVDDDLNTKSSLEQPERKCNYAKQQMKIDRLLEKQEKTVKDLCSERAINTKLTRKYQDKCMEFEGIKTHLESQREEIDKQTRRFEALLAKKNALLKDLDALKLKNSDLVSEMELVKEEIAIVKSENQDLNENLSSVINKLASEANTAVKLRLENELLLNNQCHLETKLKTDLVRQFHLKKYLVDSDALHRVSLKQLQDELVEKGTEIRTLRKQNEVASVDVFISSCNEELRRELISIYEFFNLEYDFPDRQMRFECSEDTLDLENEMILLKRYISLAISFMHDMRSKHLAVLNPPEVDLTRNEFPSHNVEFDHPEEHEHADFTINSDTFVSCLSDISDFAQEVESLSFDSDSCFENLEIDPVDLRNLSQSEREEKFATLALLLTVDVKTLQKRISSEQEKFRQMTTGFFSHLNYALHLLSQSRNNVNEVVNHLKLMKNISKDVFEVAVQCGVLHSDQRTANCWRVAINYVALLSQENKKLNEKNSALRLQVKRFPVSSFLNEDGVSCNAKNSRFKFWIYVLFLVLLCLVLLILYVDHHCPRNTKRVCPLQWILELFVEKIPSDDFRL